MKTPHIAILTAFFTVVAFSAIGADKIERAFGKKLGDVFDPASAIGTGKLTDGTPMYEVSTTNGFRSFKTYYVLITPTTHKIYSIWAIGSAENTEAGQKEQAVVMELLKKKYGVDDKQGILDTMGDVNGLAKATVTLSPSLPASRILLLIFGIMTVIWTSSPRRSDSQ